jgi:CRP-like cAMP-binding protein
MTGENYKPPEDRRQGERRNEENDFDGEERRSDERRCSNPFDFRLIERRFDERRHKFIEGFEPDRRYEQRRQDDETGPLGRYNLFSGMSSSQLRKVAEIMEIKAFEKGETIIREGCTGGEMFVLLSGSIEISKQLTLYNNVSTDPRNKSLIRLQGTDNIFFGELTMFGWEERSATVIALSDVMLGVLTRKGVHELCQRDPELGYNLFRNIGYKVSADLRRANRDILKLTTAFCLALEGK